MDVIRTIQPDGERQNVERIVFLPPAYNDLGNAPSPYAEAARSNDGAPLTWQWKVAKYQESLKITSRETYIAQKRLQPQANRPSEPSNEISVSTAQIVEQGDADRASLAQEDTLTRSGTRTIQDESVPDSLSVRKNLNDQSNESAPEHAQTTVSSVAAAAPERTIEPEESDPSDAHAESHNDQPNISTKQTRSKNLPRAKLALGPARRVGISKKSSTVRPVFLKDLEESKRKARESPKDQSLMQSIINESESGQDDLVSIAAPTTITNVAETTAGFESIAPPPAYRFTLAELTSIASLLNDNDDTRPGQYENDYNMHQPLISLLAIVRRVGQLEYVRDWKAGYNKQMGRCEVVIQDGQGYTLKVVLQGLCAEMWAGFHDITDQSASSYAFSAADDQSGYLDSRSYFDFDKGFDSASMLAKREDLRLMPLQEGDVVHLDKLRMARKSNQRLQSRQDATEVEQNGTSLYAIASETNRSTLEVCWRSTGHRHKIFDAHLPYIDGRCDAIYKLHQSWLSFQ
ncbi:uncharacterized protein FA14DRAFT_159125 [Meira miltonrushii]|uniref:Uncharacterized protein n=1 Tax=Meira miltonrushii TaxID=1280837 RepID=A0A316VGT8_9BASI|nr:uncharacterized protein FA14DRAFT_159125 [Meira miltonrushii]PWN36730.1 hypothetical protein FA14DRAFT_159125 [Meira miltonrushii]